MTKAEKRKEACRLYWVSCNGFSEHDQECNEMLDYLIRNGMLTEKGYDHAIKEFSGIEEQISK